jgi:sec-independent protein translocase protein TatA
MGRSFFNPATLLLILLIVLLLFGGKRLPSMARGLGESLRIFKKEVRNDGETAKPEDPETKP